MPDNVKSWREIAQKEKQRVNPPAVTDELAVDTTNMQGLDKEYITADYVQPDVLPQGDRRTAEDAVIPNDDEKPLSQRISEGGRRIGNMFNAGVDKAGAILSRAPEGAYDQFAAMHNFAKRYGAVPTMPAMPYSEEISEKTGIHNRLAEYLDERSAQFEADAEAINPGQERSFQGAIQQGDYGLAAENLFGMVAQSIPTTLAIMATRNVAGGAGSTAIMTGGFAAENQQEMLESKPDMDREVLQLASGIKGYAESFFENTFGAGAMGDALSAIIKSGGKQTAKLGLKDGLSKWFTNMVIKNPKLAMFGEMFEEINTQIVQNAVDKYSGYDPERDLMSGVVDAGASGLLMGGVFSATAEGVNRVQNRKNRAKYISNLTSNQKTALKSILNDSGDPSDILNELDSFTSTMDNDTRIGVYTYAGLKIADVGSAIMQRNAERNEAVRRIDEQVNNVVATNKHNTLDNIIAVTDDEGNTFFVKEGLIAQNENGAILGDELLVVVDEQGNKSMMPKSKVTGVDSKPTSDVANEMKARGIQDSDAAINALHSQNRQEDDILVSEGQQFVTPDGRNIMIASELGDVTGKDGRPVKMFAIEVNGELQDNPVDEKALASMIKESVAAEEAAKVQEVAQAAQKQAQAQARQDTETQVQKPEDVDYDALLQSDPQAFYTAFSEEFGEQEAANTLQGVKNAIQVKIKALETKMTKSSSLNEIAKIKREIATLRTQLNTYDNVTAKQTEGTGTDNAQDAPVTTPVLQPTQQERVSTDPVVGEQDAQQDGDVTPELEAIPPVTETKVPTLTEEQAARQGLNEREIPQKPVFTAEQKEATTEPDTDVGIINSTKNDIQQTLDNAIYNPLKPEKTTTERLSIADVLKMQDPSYAIERGGKNQIGNRIERAKEFLLTKPKQLEPSIIYFRDDGTIGFQDGRHRLLAAQDLGAEYAHFEIDNTSEQQERLTKFKQGESWKKIKQQPEPEITQPPKPVENYEEVMPVAGNRRIVRLTDNGRVVLKVVDANDIEVDSKKQSSALTQMRKEYDFDQGKTVTELFEDNEIDQDEIADNETFEQSVIKHSQNPAEVLNVMGRIPIYTPIDELDAKEHAIWLNMTKITGKSWNRFADRNMMTMTIARAYLSSKEGRGIDQIATEASSTLEMEVTPQDVVDFILRYPNGSQMFERQNTPEYLDAADRFYKLTGLAPTKNLIERYADFMPKANRVNALSDAVAEVVEMRLQSGEDEQMIYDAIMQELKYLEESSQLISQEEYNNLFLQQNQSEDESEPTTEDESTDTGGDRGSGDGNGNQDEGEPGDGYKTPENEVETREAKVKRLENELRVKSREYGKAARTYQRLKDKYENSPEYGGKGQTDINGNIAGSDVLDFGDGKETRKLVETAKKEAEALRADVDRIQSELDALNNVSDNQTDMLGGLFAADNTEQKPISPVRVNGMFVINENGSVSKEFRDKINTLKKSNDQAGLNDVYTTIRIILNGVAQSKGDATVKEFEALKSELDEYAKSKKPQPTNVVDFLESVPEKPRSIKQIIKKLELENKSTIPKIPVEKVFLNPVGETPSGSRTEVDKYIESESISELPIESIKVSDIIPTQKNLTTNNIESTVNVDEKPVLLNVNGKYYVMDGHHRIANRILAGDKTVDAYVYTEKKTPTKKAERTKNYGKSNKVVSEDAKNAALERMRKRRNNLNTGIDPQDMLDGITVAVYHVEAGTRKFTEWAKEMMADMGDWVKPYLKSWYNAVRDYPGMEDYESDMTSYDEVKKFDLTKIENSSTFDNIKENSDVSDRPDSSQRDSQDTKPEISTDEKNVPGNRTGSRQDGDQTQETGGTGIGQRGGKSGSGLFTDLFGESVDNKLHSTNKKQGTKNDDAGNFDGRGNDLTRTNGNNDNDTKASEQSSKADEGVSTSFIERTRQRIAQQKKVEATPVKIMDEANIRETLPVLLPEQQDDVLKAETRFFSDEHKTKERAFGKGMLFTNGTGTGKTYTGLGIIKRFAKQGKDNILIVVPSEAKIKDWIADGVNLNLDITALENTKDQGKGINITTYATFRANENLKNRDFDLIVYDESHRLMEEKNGAASSTTRAHYLHSNVSVSQAFARLTDVHPAWIRLRGLLDDYRNMNVAMNNDIATFPEQAADEIKEIEKLLNEADAEVKRLTPEIMKRAEQAYAKTKVVFLSATPFKGHFNLRYANESLFDWGNETTYESASRGQSRVHPEGRFFLDNFGAAYEWKFHRLQTRSNANAEAIAMQEVAFAEKLIKDGVMSGRAIESDKDYSREFPLVALDQSEVMNAAFSDIFNYETREFDEMMSSAREVFYNYQYSTRLFESLKASMSIDRIKKHLDKGRKVVVFHRRKLANVQPPFKLILQETRNAADALLQSDDPVKKQIGSRMMQQAEAFEKKYAGLLKYEQTLNYDSAIDQIIGAFGIDRVGLVNGDVSKKQKVDNIRQFNNDKSGVDILIVQEEAGKEGISLHDTSGKHQRVLISLSMPISSTTALQIEGRIFRIGQETDAIFEYPLLGLNMEIENFGRSINRKLSTTENLAIGDQSRDLLRSFAEGVLFNSSTDDPNDNQGIGGKEYDKREKMSISDFQKAILVYNTNQKKRGRRDSREGVDYYATPEPVGQKMVEWLNLKPNDVGMEPSAGHGAIAMWFPESVSSVVIEPSYSLFSKLNARAGGGTRKMINSTFEEFNVINKVNGIAMNPPFGSGGKMAMDHIEKAFKHLKPYGRIVALIPNGGSMNKRLDNFLYGEDDKGKLINPDAHIIADIKLPSSTFEQAGTSVNTRIVVIDKLPPDKTLNEIRVEVGKEQTAKLFQGGRSAIMLSNEQADAEAQKRFDAQKRANIHIYNYDLSDAKNIDELFERIEFIELPARIKSPEVKEETEQQPDEKAVEPSGSGYETFTHTHTKTGEQMYMVKFADRVDRDEYDRVNSLAKRFGKGWNKFAKGFHFTSEEDRQNFLDKAFTKGKESKQNNISLLYESEELYNEHKKDEDQKAFSKETNDKAEERISEILREPGYVYPGRGESTLSPKIKPRTVVRGFKESGYVDFIGQKIESPQDIADLFAVHRSPYIEKAHVVFVKNGVIVGTTASTLNVAGRTRMPDLNHVDDLYHKYEADGMYYLHNHPSGNHLVSLQDVYVTFAHKEAFDQTGINLIGHIVIDTDKFSYIDAGNKPNDYKDRRELEVYTENVKSFSYKNPVAKLFSDRENINENNDPQGRMFQIAKALLGEKGYKGAIVYLSNNLSITGYDVIPEGATVDQIKRKTKGAIKRNVGSRVIIIHDGSTEYSWSYLPGAVLDVINTKKMSSDRYLSAQEVEDNESTYKELWDNEAEYTRNIVNPKTGLYSPTELALQNVKQDKGTPDQMKAMLLKNGAKQAELDYMGWDEAFGLQDLDPTKTIAGKGVKVIITKADIQQWIDENKIEVEEVRKGTNVKSYKDEFGVDRFEMTDEEREIADADVERGLFDDTKFSGYQLPGGENYKEVLLTMPGKSKPKLNVTKESWTYGNINGEIEKIPGDIYQVYKSGKEFFKAKNLSEVKNGLKERISDYDGLAEEAKGEFKSSHFDEPNIIAHVRFNERTGENGERVLFLEEIQSDWAQKGKKEGFASTKSEKRKKELLAKDELTKSELDELDQLNKELGFNSPVPDMPFKQTPQWVNLALRRMIRYAAENGFDRVAWTTGEQQAERYDLSKQVENVIATPRDNGLYDISIGLKGNTRSEDYKSKTPEQLEGIIGKELTQKIVNNEGTRIPRTTAKNPIKYNYEGNDLKVGGEGMKDFYDNIIKSTASKLIKKYGGRVETIEMETGTQQSFAITPELAQVAMSEGMPLFSLLGKKGAAQLDRAEEATTRLDNLSVAREMEKSETEPKQIKLATGWERGADGKWRYEIPDPKLKKSFNDLKKLSFYRDNVYSDELPLTDIISDKELFAAYPELKNVKTVYYEIKPGITTGGFLDLEKKVIGIGLSPVQYGRDTQRLQGGRTVFAYDDTSLTSVLSHEIQHFIQTIEGFDAGANKNDLWESLVDDKLLQLQKDGQLEGIPTEAERVNKAVAALKSEGLTKYLAYLYKGGEVEARNVQLRMNMTPEERRNTLISETEDVSRQDQIFLNRSFGIEQSVIGEQAQGNVYASFLETARKLEQHGETPENIYLTTGWERGTDGKWRYDLPDKGFKVNEPKVGAEPVRGKLSDFVEHPALFKAYPELKDLEMVFYREGQLEPYKDNLEAYNDGKEIGINTTRLSRGHMGGIFGNTRLVNNDTPRDNGLLLKEKVIHEAQHAIQRLEGFTGGTSRSNSGAIEYRQERIDKAKDDIKFLTEFAQNSTGKNKLDAERSIRKLKERISKLESGELDYEYYKNAAGEVEARNASKRMAMTDEERKQNPISSTEDVARESQVLITGESLNAFESETRPDEPENAVDLITNDYAQKVYSFEKKAREQAEKVADNLGVKVKVVASEDEIPSKYLNSMQAKGLSGRAQAFYSPETGEIYIILANIRSTDEIRKIIFHEAVGHKGLRLVFGRKYNRLLDSIYSQMTNEQIAEIEELGYNVADPREIADEFLAYKAPYAKKPNFIQKAIAKIREWIRQLIGLDYSENDVNYLFDLSQKALGKQKEYDNVVDFLNDGVRAEVRKVTPPNKTVNEPSNAVEYLENFKNETPGTGSANNRNNSKQPLGETITIGGKERPTKNSNGQYIAGDEASIRKFYEWFGDSKVVDEKGRPLVVYHGTDKMFDSFKDDVTYFTPDKNEANGYAQYRYGKGKARTVSVYLKIENEATEEKLNEVATKLGVYDNTEPLAPLAQNVSVKNELIKQGYDGVMNINDFGFLSDFNEIQVHVIFSNSQIKSATGNNGDYNPDDDDIRFAVKVNGKLPESVNKEVDMRLKANRGLKTETMKQKLARWKSEIKDTARHFKHITQKDYPSVYNKLRLFESIPDVARKQAYDRIAKIVRPIASNKTLFEAFEKYIVLRDLNSDIERGKYDGKELPWGYNSPQEVKTDVLNLMKFMYQNPTLRDAIAQRDEFMQEVRDQLIDNGMLPESSKENKYYFHHQVHLYMESKFEQLVSAKGADVRNKSKGWQKSRTGSMLDYNTNYIESEFEVMVQSLEQIKIKESLNKLGAEINIMPALVERVKNEGGRYQDYIPDGYVRWYPIKGTHPYKAASMAEKAIQNILQQDPDNADLDRLVAEADMNIWIIPQPVAKQLNDMKDSERENFLVRGMGSLNSKWKQWVLINPYRVLKYNLNNMSGDLDIVLAFDPRILKPQYAHKAMLELRDNVKGNIMSEDMMEAMEQGVITSGLTIQEIPEINSEGVFKSLTGSDHLIAKYWRKSKDYTQFRENMLRLAAYKYFKDQVRKGVKTYGASEKASVDAITDPIEKAGKLARELIGDYGNLSRGGIWMRSHVYPFWSWVEINAPRYYRLLKNTRHEEMDNASGKRVGGVIAAKVGFNAAKLSFKMMLLSGLVTLWNSLFFPDEDDELDKAGNRRLNLIVGRREDGSIMTVRINGAFSDMLSWADLEDAPLDVKEVASGKVTPMKKAKEAGSAFVNKFAQGLMPFEKLTAEIISGKSFYPDVFNPRPIRDKGEHASRMVSMDKLYRYLTKKPLRGAKELTSLLIYDADPGETSYYTMRQRIYDFLDEKEVPSPSGSPTERSNALYYYKQSVKLKDEDLADYWYEKYMELGGSAKGMKASIKKGEVLAPLPKAYRDEFIQSLDNEDMDVLRMAEAWYDKTYK